MSKKPQKPSPPSRHRTAKEAPVTESDAADPSEVGQEPGPDNSPDSPADDTHRSDGADVSGDPPLDPPIPQPPMPAKIAPVAPADAATIPYDERQSLGAALKQTETHLGRVRQYLEKYAVPDAPAVDPGELAEALSYWETVEQCLGRIREAIAPKVTR